MDQAAGAGLTGRGLDGGEIAFLYASWGLEADAAGRVGKSRICRRARLRKEGKRTCGGRVFGIETVIEAHLILLVLIAGLDSERRKEKNEREAGALAEGGVRCLNLSSSSYNSLTRSYTLSAQ